MPEICHFYGIIIRMYFADHPPPHFHAEYGEHEALVAIEGLRLFAGDLPARAWSLVREWALLHQEELLTLWRGLVNQDRWPRSNLWHSHQMTQPNQALQRTLASARAAELSR